MKKNFSSKLSGYKKVERISVLGLGGIGANLMLMFRNDEPDLQKAAVGYDDDVLDMSNCNRIPAQLVMIGAAKTAVINTYCFPKAIFWHRRVNKYEDMKNDYVDVDKTLVIDCRDSLRKDIFFDEIAIKLAYNGGNNFALNIEPTASIKYTLDVTETTGSAYAVTPSFYPPPIIASAMGLHVCQFKPMLKKHGMSKYSNFNIAQLINSCVKPIATIPMLQPST